MVDDEVLDHVLHGLLVVDADGIEARDVLVDADGRDARLAHAAQDVLEHGRLLDGVDDEDDAVEA